MDDREQVDDSLVSISFQIDSASSSFSLELRMFREFSHQSSRQIPSTRRDNCMRVKVRPRNEFLRYAEIRHHIN